MNRRILAVLSFGHFAVDLVQGTLPALLPGFKVAFHLSYAQVGLLVLMASVSSSVIQPVFGFLSDRVRMHWLMPLGALVSGAAMALTVHAPTYGIMVVFLLLAGLGIAAFHPEGYRFAGLASGNRRSTGMGYFAVGGNLGYGLGTALATIGLSLAGAYGISYLPLCSIVASILLWRAMHPRQRAELQHAWDTADHAGGHPKALGGTLRSRSTIIITLLLLFVIIRSWVQMGIATFIPLYFASIRHADPRFAGLLVSVFLGVGGVGTLLGGYAADRWGRRRLLIYSMMVLPFALWALMRTSAGWAFVAAAVGGMSILSTFALVMVIAQEVFPGRVGMISGLMIGFGVGMGGIGATLLGSIADRWGLPLAMDVLTLLPLLTLAIVLGLPADPPAGGSESKTVTPAGEPVVSGNLKHD